MTVPAEFPATSLSCISIFPKRYSFLDWNPEPEALSRERVRSSPLLRMLARPSPHVMSMSWYKLADAAVKKVIAIIGRMRAIEKVLEAILNLYCVFCSGEW